MSLLLNSLSRFVIAFQLDGKEGWALKNWCFQIMMLEKTLESPLYCKEIKPVIPKGNQWWIFIRRTVAEAEVPNLWPQCEEPTHWKRLRWWERLKAKEKGIAEAEIDNITDSVDMKLSKLQEIMQDSGAWPAAVCGIAKSGKWLNNKR